MYIYNKQHFSLFAVVFHIPLPLFPIPCCIMSLLGLCPEEFTVCLYFNRLIAGYT